VERAVDNKLRPAQGNALVASLAAEMKAKYRGQILEQAAAARSKGGGSSGERTAIRSNRAASD
jgi:hypothetical protein